MELENKMLKMYINVSSEVKGLEYDNQKEENFKEGIKIQNKIEKREYFLSKTRELLKSIKK